MPNRPLKRGENLLDIWDQTTAKQDRAHAKNSLKRNRKNKETTPVDIGALIGPQKLSNWFT